MATWRSLPGMALGSMVEIWHHRSPWCSALGHQPVWRTDQLACGRHGCRQAFPASTKAILAEFASLEGIVVVADELQRRHVEGWNTDDDTTGSW
jgi:predicted NBD/HSP70 family sugar kinase